MTVERTDILIVGAGLAGARCAEVLRAWGDDGRILVVGDEPHPPYERPALSKELLVGIRAAAGLALRKPGFWAAHGIELRLGTRIDSIDVRARRAVIGPASIRWNRLVLATGVRARRIRGLDGMAGIHHLRTLDEAEILRDALAPGARLAIVGAGFVGLEVASSARALGLEVTVIEPATVPFERTLGPAVGSLLAERARRSGVDLRLGMPIRAAVRGGGGAVAAVELGDGTRLACDAVLVGVGARPNTELAAGLFDLAPDGGPPDRRLWANGGRLRVRLRRRRERRAPVSGPARQARALERRRGDGPGHRRRHPRPRAGTLTRAVLLVGSVRVADSGSRPRRPHAPGERRGRRRALRGAVSRHRRAATGCGRRQPGRPSRRAAERAGRR